MYISLSLYIYIYMYSYAEEPVRPARAGRGSVGAAQQHHLSGGDRRETLLVYICYIYIYIYIYIHSYICYIIYLHVIYGVICTYLCNIHDYICYMYLFKYLCYIIIRCETMLTMYYDLYYSDLVLYNVMLYSII